MQTAVRRLVIDAGGLPLGQGLVDVVPGLFLGLAQAVAQPGQDGPVLLVYPFGALASGVPLEAETFGLGVRFLLQARVSFQFQIGLLDSLIQLAALLVGLTAGLGQIFGQTGLQIRTFADRGLQLLPGRVVFQAQPGDLFLQTVPPRLFLAGCFLEPAQSLFLPGRLGSLGGQNLLKLAYFQADVCFRNSGVERDHLSLH